MSDHPLSIYVQPGGEGYVKWAKARLRGLTALRKDLALPSLRKHFQIDSSTRVELRATEWGDRIRITAGELLRYFYAASYPPPTAGFSVEYDSTGGTVPPDTVVSTSDWIVTLDGEFYASGSGSITGFYTGTLTGGGAPLDGVTTQITVAYLLPTTDTIHTSTLTTEWFGGFPGATMGGPGVTERLPALVAAENAAYTTGTANIQAGMTNAAVATLATDGHPTFTPPPDVIFKNGEKITVVRLLYTFTDPPAGESEFPGGTITQARIVEAKQYKYTASTASWSFVKILPLHDSAGAVAVDATHPADADYGNIVFVSEKPLTGQGDDENQLETTYLAQAASLDALASDPLPAWSSTELLRWTRATLYP